MPPDLLHAPLENLSAVHLEGFEAAGGAFLTLREVGPRNSFKIVHHDSHTSLSKGKGDRDLGRGPAIVLPASLANHTHEDTMLPAVTLSAGASQFGAMRSDKVQVM